MTELAEEAGIVLLFGLTPLHFGEGCHAGQGHVLHVVERVDIFGPDVGLHAPDVRFLFVGEHLGEWIETIDLLDGDITTDGERFVTAILALIIVEIEVSSRNHDGMMTLTGCFDGAFSSAPRHHDGVVGDAAFEDLVPTDGGVAVGGEIIIDLTGEPALQFLFGSELLVLLQAQFAHLGLALGTFLPAHLGTFVTADVDVLRGEDVHDFVEDVCAELHHFGIAHAEHIVADAPPADDVVGTTRAAQLRIGSQGALHVAGHLDFGNHLDVAFGSIANNLAGFLLREIAGIGDGVVRTEVTSDHRALANGTDGGEFGILLDLDAPALVVGEMPVEGVHVVESKHVDVGLDAVDGEEVAAYVEVQ